MWHRRLAIAASLLTLSVVSTRLHAQTPGGDVIAGRVVSATDGHTLAHAMVSLANIKTNQTVTTVYSDEEGIYRFEDVPAGRYRLLGQAEHYLPAAYLAHEPYSTAIVTGAGLATDALILKLTPMGLISGYVREDSGEPVEQAQVTLYREDPLDTKRITRSRITQTGADGEYEFSGLASGRYYIEANGTPWYAVHPPLETDGQQIYRLYRAAVDPALEVAYPTVFYPNAFDSKDASPIAIHGGEQFTANLPMHPEHAVTLKLRLGDGKQPNQRDVQLTRQVFGSEEVVSAQVHGFGGDGMRSIFGVPPGRYGVQETGVGGGLAVLRDSIDIGDQPAILNLEKRAEFGHASVTVHGANGVALPPQTQVLLRGDSERVTSGTVNYKGIAEFASLPPGAYDLTVLSRGRMLHVLGVTMNGKPLTDKRLRVADSGEVAVDATVLPVTVEVDGLASRAGKPAEGTMIVLVPVGADTSEYLFRRDQSDLDGSFSFKDVGSGEYIVIAIDDGWELNWNDAATLAPYLMHGVPLAIGAENQATVQVGGKVEAQARR